jgi:hypothetical protein
MANDMTHSAIKKYGITLLSCIVCALSSGAMAQDATDEELELPKVYQVDIIVFRNANAAQISTETWPNDAQQADSLYKENPLSPGNQIKPPASLDSFVLESVATAPLYYPSNGLGEPGFLLLEPVSSTLEFKLITNADESRGLNTEFEKIRDNNDYAPMLYATWRQEVADKKTANSFNVAATGVPPDTLSGTVRLYKERYLHLVLNIEMSESSGFSSRSVPVKFRINQSRRLRRETVQYFDHPMFGAIALVKEIVPLETDEETDE